MEWTTDRVLALAPDAGSAKAGRGLAVETPWRGLGQSTAAIWGECQGSGATPYRTQIDLDDPAFKCSCPSRKFPCKHGLGLMLLWAERASLFPSAAPPDWVAEWLARREAKAKPREATPADAETLARREAARERRAEDREARVAEGLAELQRWLADLLAQGLAAARQRPSRSWDAMAARLIDAQAPGAARLVAECASLAVAGDDWAERLLHRLARLHLLVEAHRRIDRMPPPLRADIRTAIGWSTAEDEVQAGGERIADAWSVLGHALEDDGRLKAQRVWLKGARSGRSALLLSFGIRGQGLPVAPPLGTAFEATLAFYPSAAPLRALVCDRGDAAPLAARGAPNVDTALMAYAEALAQNPFLERFPMLIQGATVRERGGFWLIADAEGRALPIRRGFQRGWEMMAVDGGRGATVFGEWNGLDFHPLTIFDAAAPVALAA